MSAVRRARLDALGFDWNAREAVWEQRFTELIRYKERFGHCSVPAKWHENRLLGTWVWLQRRRERKDTLSADQKVRLDALGFSWDARDTAWEIRFSELKRYKEQLGHCNVPHKWAENPQLAKWVAHLRRFEKTGKLSSARKARLNEMGFAFDPTGMARETMFAELERFKERFGHCNVPQQWDENPNLGTWVASQRDQQRQRTITAEQSARLDALRFDWNARDAVWELRFTELKRYKRRFGHCNVPKEWAENPQLGRWVANQRMRQKKFSRERKALLDALGFNWSRRS